MKIITILLLLFTIQVSSQYVSRFDKGYNDGFKKGYCHNKDMTCFSPEPPVSSAPNWQESDDSYADGFSRGLANGISSNNSSNNNTSWNRKPMQRRTDFAKPLNADLFGRVATQLQSRITYRQPVVYYKKRTANQNKQRFAYNYSKLQKAKAKVTHLYSLSIKRDLNKKQRRKISVIFSKWIDWQETQRNSRALSKNDYIGKLEKEYLKTYNSIVKIINK